MPIVFQALPRTMGKSSEQDRSLHFRGKRQTKNMQKKCSHIGVCAPQKTNEHQGDAIVP